MRLHRTAEKRGRDKPPDGFRVVGVGVQHHFSRVASDGACPSRYRHRHHHTHARTHSRTHATHDATFPADRPSANKQSPNVRYISCPGGEGTASAIAFVAEISKSVVCSVGAQRRQAGARQRKRPTQSNSDPACAQKEPPHRLITISSPTHRPHEPSILFRWVRYFTSTHGKILFRGVHRHTIVTRAPFGAAIGATGRDSSSLIISP